MDPEGFPARTDRSAGHGLIYLVATTGHPNYGDEFIAAGRKAKLAWSIYGVDAVP